MKIHALAALLLFSCAALADMNAFHDGPVIAGYGKHAATRADLQIPSGTRFKIVFDVSEAGDAAAVNRGFDSIARFLNMHVAAGVPEADIELALVVHGGAAMDLAKDPVYRRKHHVNNPNSELLARLREHNVRIVLCGQTAAAYDIGHAELTDGVQIALSAMTAHALLAQQGYSLNPF